MWVVLGSPVLAGLVAARALQVAGRSCACIEAPLSSAAMVGQRFAAGWWGDRGSLSGTAETLVDLGAQWVGPSQSRCQAPARSATAFSRFESPHKRQDRAGVRRKPLQASPGSLPGFAERASHRQSPTADWNDANGGPGRAFEELVGPIARRSTPPPTIPAAAELDQLSFQDWIERPLPAPPFAAWYFVYFCAQSGFLARGSRQVSPVAMCSGPSAGLPKGEHARTGAAAWRRRPATGQRAGGLLATQLGEVVRLAERCGPCLQSVVQTSARANSRSWGRSPRFWSRPTEPHTPAVPRSWRCRPMAARPALFMPELPRRPPELQREIGGNGALRQNAGGCTPAPGVPQAWGLSGIAIGDPAPG